jgi:nucleoside-diphosphate-sugar epimerase
LKFTVLGASGTIGQHVAKFLRLQGADVFTPDREDSKIFGDNLGHVIYAIGVTADFRTRPIDTIQSHVCVLTDILQHADFDSLVYLSSTRIYANCATTSEENVFQVNPQDPSDLYNLSKLTGESICLFCGRAGIKIARLSNVVGGEDKDSDNFVPSLVREARLGKIILRTDLNSAKDYIHIDDVAFLLHQIAVTGRNKIYNVASGQQISHSEWINCLVSTHKCCVEVEVDAPVVHFIPIDIKRISDEFCFRPKSVFDTLLNM